MKNALTEYLQKFTYSELSEIYSYCKSFKKEDDFENVLPILEAILREKSNNEKQNKYQNNQ